VDEEHVMEWLLVEELLLMEILLVCEVAMREVQLFERIRGLRSDLSNVQLKRILNSQARLEAEMRRADERMDTARKHHNTDDNRLFETWRTAHDQIRAAWKVVLEQSVDIFDF